MGLGCLGFGEQRVLGLVVDFAAVAAVAVGRQV